MKNEEITLELIPDHMDQKEKNNTITILMKNDTLEEINPNEIQICFKLPYGDTDDDLVSIEAKDEVTAICEEEAFSLVKESSDSYIIWNLQSKGECIKPKDTLSIVIKNLACPLQEDENSCMSYIGFELDKEVTIYEVLKLMSVDNEIYEWTIKNKVGDTDFQAGFGEYITLKWATNANECILYPYGIKVLNEGEYTMKIYEDTQFTLRAIKNGIQETRTLSVKVIEQRPVIQSFKGTTDKNITLQWRYTGTSYAYINKCIGRIDNENEITMPLFCNKTGFQLTTFAGKNAKDVTATTKTGGTGLMELDYLLYTMNIVDDKIIYHVSWVLLNCEGANISIEEMTAPHEFIELSKETEGSTSFTTSKDWIAPLYIKVEKQEKEFHISELYPWNPWEESRRTTVQCYK